MVNSSYFRYGNGSRIMKVAMFLSSLASVHAVEISVMSFNIRTSLASIDAASRCSNWNGERKGNVAQQVNNVSPDFVGMQEMSLDQRGYLDGALGGKYTSIGEYSKELGTAAGEINAIYYNREQWSVLDNGMFWLGPNPDAPSADWGMQYYRTCVYGRFQHHETKKTVCLMNTHYETPGNDLAQTKGSEIIISKMNEKCQPQDSVTLVMGDLNGSPGYPAVQKLMNAGLSSSSDASTFCGDMLSPSCNVKYDYTLTKFANGACSTSSDVLRQEFAGCYPSDHAALLSKFCIDGDCCGSKSKPADTEAPAETEEPEEEEVPEAPAKSDSNEEDASGDKETMPGVVMAIMDAPPENETGTVPNETIPPPAPTAAPVPDTPEDKEAITLDIQTKQNAEDQSSPVGTLLGGLCVLGVVGVVVAGIFRAKRHLQDKTDLDKSMVDSRFAGSRSNALVIGSRQGHPSGDSEDLSEFDRRTYDFFVGSGSMGSPAMLRESSFDSVDSTPQTYRFDFAVL